MRIYKKNTLIYKIRVWMILYLGVIQTLNYVILGIVMKDEKAAFRTICVMGCLSCGLFVHLVINDFQRDSSGNGLLTEIITYIGSILAVGEFLSEFWFVKAATDASAPYLPRIPDASLPHRQSQSLFSAH